MKKRYLFAVALAKAVRTVSRSFGNGGSALPGLIVEKLAPGFLPSVLADLPDGVIVVVGTNGKTTTTKIIAELLASRQKKVLTNSSGSNFIRGIIASTVSEVRFGHCHLDKDIAVLELDEAYGKHFIDLYKPKYVVALNVMRDQLDRFGELEVTTRLIGAILQSATIGCVINGDEPELVFIGDKLKVPCRYYGVNPSLRALFPTDAELLADTDYSLPNPSKTLMVCLENFSSQEVQYRIDKSIYTVHLKLKGQYNFHNTAAALAIVGMAMPKVKVNNWLNALEKVVPAFGRGEVINFKNLTIELMLVKNPSSFRQVLLAHDDRALTMLAVNDNFADGRDVSWLWDVDFSHYESRILVVSGLRANDIALRLQYDNIEVQHVEPDLESALHLLLSETTLLPRRIFCTYTAMLSLRRMFEKLTIVEPGL